MLKRLNEVNTVDSYYNQNEVSDIKKCNLKGGGYFDRCAVIETDKRYNSKVLDTAKGILNGYMSVYPRIEPMKYDILNFDWNVSFSNIPSSFQLYLQGLNPIQILAQAFNESKDKNYLEFALKLLHSWREYASKDINIKNNRFVWGEHSTSIRAENLIYFVKICFTHGFWNNDMFEEFSEILFEHGEWLNNNKNYKKNHNHGIIMDKVLLYLGYVFDNKNWMENAKKRLLEQEHFAFNEEMIHVENSTTYGFLVRRLFLNIGDFLKKINDDLSKRILLDMEKTTEFLNWSVKPNGKIALIGDTNESPCDIVFKEDIKKFYPITGMFFYCSNKEKEYKNNTWKMFKSGYTKNVHKHADDGSFILYSKGYDIFIDGGNYGYQKDDFRNFFLSAKAHNSIVIDDKSYPTSNKLTDTVGISEYLINTEYDYIKAFNKAYEGVKLERKFYSSGDITILYDNMYSENRHKYSQIFNLSEFMKIEKIEENKVILKIADTDYYVEIIQYANNPLLSVIEGNINVAGYGLISRSVNKIETITTLKFDLEGENCNFITLISIVDKYGNVKMNEGICKKEDLIFNNLSQTFNLDNIKIE